MISRYEILYEPWEFDSYKDVCKFALKWCNYYDLHNEIEHIAENKFYVIFTEQEND